jgi:hypothetical protein
VASHRDAERVAPAGPSRRPAAPPARKQRPQGAPPSRRPPAAPPAPPAELDALPAHLREKAQAALAEDEHVVWVGRPWGRITALQILPMVLGGLVFVFGPLLVLVVFLLFLRPEGLGATLGVSAVLLFFSLFGVVFTCLAPLGSLSTARNTAYVLTNHRALVLFRKPGSDGAVESYSPRRLQLMRRKDARLAAGGGDLIMATDVSNEVQAGAGGGSGGRAGTRGVVSRVPHGFLHIARVKEVEELIHTTLLGPVSAAALAEEAEPAPPPAAAPGARAARPSGAPPAGRAGRAAAGVNVKLPEAPPELGEWEVPPHLKDRVAEELGRGERVVWAGRPSRRIVILRGLWLPALMVVLSLLFLAGAFNSLLAQMQSDPTYLRWGFVAVSLLYALYGFTLVPLKKLWRASRTGYVLTNRRALVWRPGSWFGRLRMDEYPPEHVARLRRRNSWVFPGAGDLVFKTVSTTTLTVERGRPHDPGRVTDFKTEQFGFLAIWKVREVEALLRTVLVEPSQAR